MRPLLNDRTRPGFARVQRELARRGMGLTGRRARAAQGRVQSFGAVDYTDHCVTEQAAARSFQETWKWCSCARWWGSDYIGPIWAPAVAAASPFVVSPPTKPVDGPAPWGSQFTPFDFLGNAVKRWLGVLIEKPEFGGGPAITTCGYDPSIGLLWKAGGRPEGRPKNGGEILKQGLDSGLCCLICVTELAPDASSLRGCMALNNSCAAELGPSSRYRFGGPVLEYFNFTRVLRLLAQWPNLENLGTFGTNFRVDPVLAGGMRTAHKNLSEFLGGVWPELAATQPSKQDPRMLEVPFDSKLNGVVTSRILNHRKPMRPHVVEHGLGPDGRTPWNFYAWFNRLRWLAQRVPGGDGWHCVWHTPTLTDLDTPFNPELGDATGRVPVLYRHTASATILAGDWLANVLDLLAPGWHVPSAKSVLVPKFGVKPSGSVAAAGTVSPAVTAIAAVAAAGGAAALVWSLL